MVQIVHRLSGSVNMKKNIKKNFTDYRFLFLKPPGWGVLTFSFSRVLEGCAGMFFIKSFQSLFQDLKIGLCEEMSLAALQRNESSRVMADAGIVSAINCYEPNIQQ